MKIWGSFFLIFCCILFSCKKEKISKNHPELVGTWKEINGLDTYSKLAIENNGSGTLYDCHPGDCGDIQFRKWRIKNNHLFYGVANDLGEISQFPSTATSDIVLGIGINDTIKSGSRYMILNHNYFEDISH